MLQIVFPDNVTRKIPLEVINNLNDHLHNTGRFPPKYNRKIRS